MKSLLSDKDYFKDPHHPLAILQGKQNNPPLHCHEFTELVVVQGGAGRHILEDGSYDLQPGDVFVIAGQMKHAYRSPFLDITNILFKESYLLASAPELVNLAGYQALFRLEPRLRQQHKFGSHLRLDALAMSEVLQKIEKMKKELAGRQEGYAMAALAVFIGLVVDLCRLINESPGHSSQSLVKVGRVMGYLEQNYRQPMELEVMAEMAHLSARSLLRHFRQATGFPPLGYLQQVRIKHACELLRSTDLSVGEIGAQVGFEDSNYFTRQFRKTKKCSPRQYRAGGG